MEVLFANFIGIILAFFLLDLTNKNNKIYNTSVILLMLSSVMWLSLYFIWFYPLKGFSTHHLFFVDEFTYLYNLSHLSSFSCFLRIITENLGVTGFYLISSFLFAWSLFRIPKIYHFNLSIINFLILLLISSSFYWSLFILKETLSISGALMLLFPGKNNKSFIIIGGALLVLLSRPEILLIVSFAYLVTTLRKKNKLILFVLIFLTIVISIFYLNSYMGTQLRISILARAEGAGQKEFSPEVFSLSSGSLFRFFSSDLYRETIITNIITTLKPKFNPIFPMYLLNLIAIYFMIKNWNKNSARVSYVFLIFFISLLTHSQIRYVLSGSIVGTFSYIINTKRCDSVESK